MTLAEVTPVVLTFNEELNIGRTLESVRDFECVVVVDSGSTDRTEEISRGFPNVKWFCRAFDGHVSQWTFALHETGIRSEFVLALDADMSISRELAQEIANVASGGLADAGLISVAYQIRGVDLCGSLYPSELRLLRRPMARVTSAGHTQKFAVSGRVHRLRARLIHDDRKPLERFVRAQLGYSAKELPRLFSSEAPKLSARVRRAFPFTPIAVWAWAWIRAGGPLRGAAARRYALERLLYEAMLRWRVEDELLSQAKPSEAKRDEKNR